MMHDDVRSRALCSRSVAAFVPHSLNSELRIVFAPGEVK